MNAAIQNNIASLVKTGKVPSMDLWSIPETEHADFHALGQNEKDHSVPVVHVQPAGLGDCMVICLGTGAVYITKAQALHFFNLKETT